MARPKSVILSKDEKKLVISGLKTKLAEIKAQLKAIAGVRKNADRAYATAGKEHIAILKSNDRAVAVANKELAATEAQLSAMTAPAVAA